MNSTPPPLPSVHDGFEDEDRNAFSRQAAKASAIAPFLTMALGYGCHSVMQNTQDTGLRALPLLLGVASGLLVVGGFILGILALVCMKPGGRGTIIFRATSGILISSLLLAIAVPNFLRARRQALANHKAYGEFQSAATDFRSEAMRALKEGRSADVGSFMQRLDDAGKTSNGEAAALLKGTSAYLQKLQSLQATYNGALRDLTNSHVLRSSDLTERDQVQPRREAVQKFLNANDTIIDFLKASEENFRAELVRQQVSSHAISSAVLEFRKGSAAQRPLLAEIRQTDTRIGQAMLGVLDLLDSNWGQWEYRAASSKLRFSSTNVLQRYNAYLRDLDLAREEQNAAQQRLALVMSQKAPAR